MSNREFLIPTGMSIAEFVQSSPVLSEALKEWIDLGLHDPQYDTLEDFYYSFIDTDEFKEISSKNPKLNHTIPDSLSDLGAEFYDNGQVIMPDGTIIDLWDSNVIDSGFTDKIYNLEDEMNKTQIPTTELKTMEEYRYDEFIDEYAINNPYMSYSQRQEYLASKFPEFKDMIMKQTVINPSYLSNYNGKRDELGRRTKIAAIEEELRSRTPALYSSIEAKINSTTLPATYIHERAIKIYDSGFDSLVEYEYHHGIGSGTLFQFQDNHPIPLGNNTILHNNNGIYHFEQGGNTMIQPNPVNNGMTKPAPINTTNKGVGTFENKNIGSMNEMLEKIKETQNTLEVKAPKELPPSPGITPPLVPIIPKVQEQNTTPNPMNNQNIPIQITDKEISDVTSETLKTMSVHERADKVVKELEEELKHEEEQKRKGITVEDPYNIGSFHIPKREFDDPLIERFRSSKSTEDTLTKLNSLDNPRLAAARIAFADFEEILGYAVISGIFPENKFNSLMKFLNLIGVGDQFTETVTLLTENEIPLEYQFTNMKIMNLKKMIKTENNVELDPEFARRSKVVNDKKPLFGSITKTHIIDLLDYINRNGIFVHFSDPNIQYAYSELAKYTQDHVYTDRVAHSWRSLITYICEELGNTDQLLLESYTLTYGKDPKVKKKNKEDIIMNNKEIINTTMAATIPNPMRTTLPTQPVIQTAANGTNQPIIPQPTVMSSQNPGLQNTVQTQQPAVNPVPQSTVQVNGTIPNQNIGNPCAIPQGVNQNQGIPQPNQYVQPNQTINNQYTQPNQGINNQYTQPAVTQYVQPTNQYANNQGGNMYQNQMMNQPVNQYVNVPTQPMMNQGTVNPYMTQPAVTQYVQPTNQYQQPMMQSNPYMNTNPMMNQTVNPYAPRPAANPYMNQTGANPYAQPQVNPYTQTVNPYMNTNPYMQRPTNPYMNTNPMMNQTVNPYAPRPAANPYMQTNPYMGVNPMMNQGTVNPYINTYAQPAITTVNPYMNTNPYMQRPTNPYMNTNPMMNPYMNTNPYTQQMNPYMAPQMASNPMMNPVTANPYMQMNPQMGVNPYMNQPQLNPYTQQMNPYAQPQVNPYTQTMNPYMNQSMIYGGYGRNFY